MFPFLFALICSVGVSACFVGMLCVRFGWHLWTLVGAFPFLVTLLIIVLPTRRKDNETRS